MAGVLIPFQTYMIPLVKELNVLRILRKPLALFITYIAQYTPLSVFIYSGYIRTVPKEVEEAAIVDGAGPYRIFFRIIFPLISPCTASVIIIFSILIWNSFVQPIVILGTLRWRTLFVELLTYIQDRYFQQWNMTFATCLISVLPISIIYIIWQNRIISGLTSGAVKY